MLSKRLELFMIFEFYIVVPLFCSGLWGNSSNNTDTGTNNCEDKEKVPRSSNHWADKGKVQELSNHWADKGKVQTS